MQGPDSTEVTLTYSWDDFTDERVFAMTPAVPKPAPEESLNLLAAAVEGGHDRERRHGVVGCRGATLNLMAPCSP